jgi:hypothetical protein
MMLLAAVVPKPRSSIAAVWWPCAWLLASGLLLLLLGLGLPGLRPSVELTSEVHHFL